MLKLNFIPVVFGTILLFFSSSTLFGQATQQAVDAYKKKLNIPSSADALKNPYAHNAAATDSAKVIYSKICSVCHGKGGKGDGAGAVGLTVKPANHTSGLVQMQSDGDLFYIITNGHLPMPSYKASLTEKQRWGLVNFIRTLKSSAKLSEK